MQQTVDSKLVCQRRGEKFRMAILPYSWQVITAKVSWPLMMIPGTIISLITQPNLNSNWKRFAGKSWESQVNKRTDDYLSCACWHRYRGSLPISNFFCGSFPRLFKTFLRSVFCFGSHHLLPSRLVNDEDKLAVSTSILLSLGRITLGTGWFEADKQFGLSLS